MKKLMTMALVILMGAAACQKDDTDYTDNATATNGDYVSFTASFASLASKADASYDDATKALTLSWKSGDRVGVYSSKSPILYTATSDGASTTLTTNIKIAEASSYSAVYPYLADALIEDGKLALTVPAEQEAEQGYPKYHIAVANTSATTFAFRNVTAMIRLRLDTDSVSKIEVEGNEGELIAGDIKVNTADATFSGPANSSSIITLVPAAGASVLEPGVYYVSILPQTLSRGLKVTYYSGANANTVTDEVRYTLTGNTLIVCEPFGLAVEGSQSNPFQIGSVSDLQGLSAKLVTDVPNHVVLTKDIDMGSVEEWTPVVGARDAGKVPEIHLDGRGYAIKNFSPEKFNATSDGYTASLLGIVYGSVRNLKMTDVDLTTTENTSAPLAEMVGISGKNRTVIENVEVTGTMSGAKIVGGVVATAENASFKDCVSTVAVTATDAESAGFIGRLTSGLTFTNCYATGEITGVRAAGGFAGGSNTTKNAALYDGTIEFINCYSTGKVTGTIQMGGFVGHLHTATVKITNCYATGDVTSKGSSSDKAKQIGGIAGVNSGAALTISNCYYTGKIADGYIEVGGILGVDAAGSSTITSSFAVSTITTKSGSTQNGGVVGCARANKTSITGCYAGGSITSSGNVGGILGETTTSATVKECVWGGTGTANVVGAGTTAENCSVLAEADKAAYSTASKVASKLGWDTTVWDLIGDTPKLK